MVKGYFYGSVLPANSCHSDLGAVPIEPQTQTPYGLQTEIVGCAPKTLRLHYRQELDEGSVEANAQIAINRYPSDRAFSAPVYGRRRLGHPSSRYLSPWLFAPVRGCSRREGRFSCCGLSIPSQSDSVWQ